VGRQNNKRIRIPKTKLHNFGLRAIKILFYCLICHYTIINSIIIFTFKRQSQFQRTHTSVYKIKPSVLT